MAEPLCIVNDNRAYDRYCFLAAELDLGTWPVIRLADSVEFPDNPEMNMPHSVGKEGR
jgi:hypothetical protein